MSVVLPGNGPMANIKINTVPEKYLFYPAVANIVISPPIKNVRYSMSRFTKLKKHLGFQKAISVYRKIKSGNPSNISVPCLAHPVRFRNNPFDYATFEEVLLLQTYDIPLSFEPEYIIDGGGNIGFTACYFGSKYPGALIVTVEPDKENYEVLRSNCSAYRNIKTLQCGIWKNNTNLQIENAQAGNNAFTVTESETESINSIKAVTIQHIMETFGMPHIDVLKLDVEGSEKELFQENFEYWLPKTKMLIIELHDEMKKGCSRSVFSAINQYDFSFDMKGENVLFTNNAFK